MTLTTAEVVGAMGLVLLAVLGWAVNVFGRMLREMRLQVADLRERVAVLEAERERGRT